MRIAQTLLLRNRGALSALVPQLRRRLFANFHLGSDDDLESDSHSRFDSDAIGCRTV